jgi:pyruvate kinase
MALTDHKTKIVCTIGPASESREIMEEMLRAGMEIARFDFSNGEFASHEKTIKNLRAASQSMGQRLAIMGDLPGPKMRIGRFSKEPNESGIGDPFTLTTDDIMGGQSRASVRFSSLAQVMKSGDRLYLNDVLIQLEVAKVNGKDVGCRVVQRIYSQKHCSFQAAGLDRSRQAPGKHVSEAPILLWGLSGS